jgi:carbamoyl-phosphate synthase small subunit
MSEPTVPGLLALEDGRLFRGTSFAAEGLSCGEVVFNTSMTGYQEIATDPSYCQQIVSMTYPLIGNYGVNDDNTESDKPQVAGFVVREHCRVPSNFRSQGTFGDWLSDFGIIGIEGVDTRDLTRHIRQAGAMRACLAAGDWSEKELLEKAREFSGLLGRDLVKEVTCPAAYDWPAQGTEKHFVVAYDFGIKRSILKCLAASGCRIKVLPADTPAKEALGLKPDGIFLSNGPGDPDGGPYAQKIVKKLLGKVPIFGICLGHQMLGLAMGGKTYKLKFGHRGGNQPVTEVDRHRVEITSQNHGFCIDLDSLPAEVETTHVNLNDRTSEGLRHTQMPIFSVQHHPEASPGPHDSRHLFDRFSELMTQRKAGEK